MSTIKVRIDTVDLTDDQRRAIRFDVSKKRTKATREESRKWLQDHLDRILADLDYRWNGSVVSPETAVDISEEKAAHGDAEDATP